MRFLLVLAFVACACARTAVKEPSISGPITSLTDKDARTKARVHTAFVNAGKQAGVEIWRIQNFEPVPVAASDFGKFHKGDSYIVLKTTADKKKSLSWDIHYWIGTESTQDESGAAAILTIGLDDKFNGAAVQHREVEGYESPKFLAYFPSALQYPAGGVASISNHVETNAGAKKRLYQVKGEKFAKMREVDTVISSMNKGDVFVLDKDNVIYLYIGESANNVEKTKGHDFADRVKNTDHYDLTKATLQTIDANSSDADVQKFFTVLGSGAKDLVPEASAGGDDLAFENKVKESVVLSEVNDITGHVTVTPLASWPLLSSNLDPGHSYILDTVSGSIYVWTGKQSTEREMTEAVNKAKEIMAAKKYPSWVQVEKFPELSEPAIFKQYFTVWRESYGGISHTADGRIVLRLPTYRTSARRN